MWPEYEKKDDKVAEGAPISDFAKELVDEVCVFALCPTSLYANSRMYTRTHTRANTHSRSLLLCTEHLQVRTYFRAEAKRRNVPFLNAIKVCSRTL